VCVLDRVKYGSYEYVTQTRVVRVAADGVETLITVAVRYYFVRPGRPTRPTRDCTYRTAKIVTRMFTNPGRGPFGNPKNETNVAKTRRRMARE